MDSISRTLLLSIALLGALNLSSSAPAGCGTDVSTADRCLGEAIFVGTPNIRLYKTAKEFKDGYCLESKANVKCARSFRKCLRSFPRTVYGLVLNSLKKVSDDLCRDDKSRNEFMSHFGCFDNSTVSSLTQINNRVTATFNYVADFVPEDKLIANLCCGFHQSMVQTKEMIDGICANKPGHQNTSNYFTGMIRSGLAETIDLVCAGFSSVEVCNTKDPKVMGMLSNVTQAEESSLFTSSPLLPLLNILKRLDSDI